MTFALRRSRILLMGLLSSRAVTWVLNAGFTQLHPSAGRMKIRRRYACWNGRASPPSALTGCLPAGRSEPPSAARTRPPRRPSRTRSRPPAAPGPPAGRQGSSCGGDSGATGARGRLRYANTSTRNALLISVQIAICKSHLHDSISLRCMLYVSEQSNMSCLYL